MSLNYFMDWIYPHDTLRINALRQLIGIIAFRHNLGIVLEDRQSRKLFGRVKKLSTTTARGAGLKF